MTNEELAFQVIQEAVTFGVREFCLCPGARNSPFLTLLESNSQLKIYYWFEERSAAFFALGRSKITNLPVAVIVTSGTATGELLPAVMEAHYTHVPLVLITADRPLRFRGSGAPQAAEQVGLFGVYVQECQDVTPETQCDLTCCSHQQPVHINVCLEEPKPQITLLKPILCEDQIPRMNYETAFNPHCPELDRFLDNVNYPFVVVSAVRREAMEAIAQFLVRLGAPAFLEGVSGLREDARLQHLRIASTDKLWEKSKQSGYLIDGMLRIGGIPTFRLWRDLEEKQGVVEVCSISELPFSGLSRGEVIHVPLGDFFKRCSVSKTFDGKVSKGWIQADRDEQKRLKQLYEAEPRAEPSLIRELSQKIPKKAFVFLGNSLPIREWDQAATSEQRLYSVSANRGLNGIDGQISTFLGMCVTGQSNWAILGDLTTLYDMAAPWILPQLKGIKVNLVVMNNGGGKIFSRMFEAKTFQHNHDLGFEPLAKMWGLEYQRVEDVGLLEAGIAGSGNNRLIEIVPCNEATERFWMAQA